MSRALPRTFEDITEGAVYDYGAYEVTRDEIIEFAKEFDPQPFHQDEAAATASIFRGLAASGWHTAAVTMRLLVASEFQPAGGIVGMARTAEMAFEQGDALTGPTRVIGFDMGGTSTDVSHYANQGPKLDLKTYLNGRLMAHGMFVKRGGEVARRFKVTMDATWQQENGIWVGTLDEAFEYDDGEKQRRVWTLRELQPGVYEGTASDVVGKAKGRSSGHALNWQYTLTLPVGNDRYDVQFDDWMFQMDERVMLNKARMSKFGIYLGEVTLAFYR